MANGFAQLQIKLFLQLLRIGTIDHGSDQPHHEAAQARRSAELWRCGSRLLGRTLRMKDVVCSAAASRCRGRPLSSTIRVQKHEAQPFRDDGAAVRSAAL